MTFLERSGTSAPDCFRCQHFWITHDAWHPYGCRAFAFQAARVPSLEVAASSGEPCRAFAPRNEPPRPQAQPERPAR